MKEKSYEMPLLYGEKKMTISVTVSMLQTNHQIQDKTKIMSTGWEKGYSESVQITCLSADYL